MTCSLTLEGQSNIITLSRNMFPVHLVSAFIIKKILNADNLTAGWMHLKNN